MDAHRRFTRSGDVDHVRGLEAWRPMPMGTVGPHDRSTTMNVPSSILRDRGDHPFVPADVARAVLLADDGLYEAVVARHDPDALHRSGAWRLLRHDAWTPEAVVPARALHSLLSAVRHPLAGPAAAALRDGIDAVEAAAGNGSGRHAA